MGIVRDGDTVRFDSDHPHLRVVLLICDDPQHSYLRRLVGTRLNLLATIVESGADQQRRLWRHHRYRDALYRAYQGRRQKLTGRARYRREYFGALCADLPEPDTPAHRVANVNSPEVRELVAGLRPDLTVVCGTGVLGRKLIGTVPGLMVNIHTGWLPEYKGNHCIYFAYRAADWDRIGATVHVLTPALDSGAVLDTTVPPMFPHDNDEHLYSRSVHYGVLRTIELAERLERGETISLRKQPDRGTTYRHRDRTPLPELALWLRRISGRHPVPLRAAAPPAANVPTPT
ncbi:MULTISPECIES: formyltransferase family protein [unclassified Frankia]|uniref:formyltransferase family protein n=1 Tax=unclassified Frankia TaxID=2632575 RepID=UPI0020244DA8